MADLNAEYQERAPLANQKRFYKRSGRVGSARKPIDKSKETCFGCGKLGHYQKDYPSTKTLTPSYPSSNTSFNKPKPYTPSFTSNIPQNLTNQQKDYKGKYKGLKAEMAVLTQRIDELSKGKNEKGKGDKGKKDEGTTKFKAFMAIAEDEPSVGKGDARSGQWVKITMKKIHKILSMINGEDRKHVLDYTHVDLQYVQDQRKDLVNKFNALKQELAIHKSELCNLKNTTCSKVTLDQLLSEQVSGNIVKALGGKGRRKENNSTKEFVFTKGEESSSGTAPMITSDFETDGDIQESLPALPKLIEAESSGSSTNLISLSDLTTNMAELTLNTSSKKNKKSSDKVSQTYGIKDHIKIPSVTSSSDSQASNYKRSKQKAWYGPCKHCALKKLKGQSPLKPTLRKTPRMTKQFDEYIYCGSDKHNPDDCEFYPGCKICGSIAHILADCPKNLRNSRKTKYYLKRYSKEFGPKVVFGDNSSGDTEGYGLVNCNRITFIRVAYVNGVKHNLISISQLCDANFQVLFTKTQGTILNQNAKVVLIDPRRIDVYVIDMSTYNSESNACFYAKASPSVNWLWHKRLSHLNFKTINNLAKHNLVSRIPSLTFSKDKNCSVCEKGKHHRAKFKTKRSFSIDKSLHLLYMDLFGPKKSDAADCFMSFIKQMENLNDTKVNQLRSYNGTEFKNRTLEAFCDEKGISQNFSSPCTPEENGVAERRNDEAFLIWKTFGGFTRDLGSFGEETDKNTSLHQQFQESVYSA
ncbi:retrovirus-related pol polyprotein from transposon TNT 1-94 [Tanacetum coccineum]